MADVQITSNLTTTNKASVEFKILVTEIDNETTIQYAYDNAIKLYDKVRKFSIDEYGKLNLLVR